MKDDDLEKLKTLLQNKGLVTQPDRTGLPPLQKVVILGQTDILEYLAIKHDDALNVTDNVRLLLPVMPNKHMCLVAQTFIRLLKLSETLRSDFKNQYDFGKKSVPSEILR